MRLRIRDWDKHFENAASRKLKRLDWVAIPNKTDGEGYTALVDHPNAAAHLGAWYAIVEAASKQNPRGNLPAGIPNSISGVSRSLGRMSRLPSKVFEEVIPRLLEIAWLEDADILEVQSLQQNMPFSLADSANVVADSANVVADSANVVGDVGRKVAAQGRELQGTTGNGTTSTAPGAPLKVNGHAEYPAILAEIRKHDAAADDAFARRLFATVVQFCLSSPKFPQAQLDAVTDENVARCVAESYRTGPPGHRTGLLLNRVPNIVLTWSLED